MALLIAREISMKREYIRLPARKHFPHGVDALPDFWHTRQEDEHAPALILRVGHDEPHDLSNELERPVSVEHTSLLFEPGSQAGPNG